MALPPRSDVAVAETWDAGSVFDSAQAWESEREALVKALARMAPFPGTLGQDAAQLAAWLELQDELGRRIEKLYFYAAMSQAVDNGRPGGRRDGRPGGQPLQPVHGGGLLRRAGDARAGRGDGAGYGRGSAGAAALHPLVQRPLPPGRARAFGRGGGGAGTGQRTLRAIVNTGQVLANADLRFAPATNSQGEAVEVAQGTLDTILGESDRAARRTAWESYADGHLSLKHTFASNFNAIVRRDVFNARARRYNSSLEAALFPTTSRPRSSTT